jgi:ferritin-like metal-binding protein YciE
LRDAFETHLEETRGHITRLEQVFEGLDEKARGKHCDGIEGIIEEGKSMMDEDFDDATMDACLIASGQRAEHYEIAAYGTLIAWAKAMGHEDSVELLQSILDEEKAADEKLTSLAEAGINQEAADAVSSDEEPEEEESEGEETEKAQPAGRGASRGTGRSASKSKR